MTHDDVAFSLHASWASYFTVVLVHGRVLNSMNLSDPDIVDIILTMHADTIARSRPWTATSHENLGLVSDSLPDHWSGHGQMICLINTPVTPARQQTGVRLRLQSRLTIGAACA